MVSLWGWVEVAVVEQAIHLLVVEVETGVLRYL
jgi:hypothetical protein